MTMMITFSVFKQKQKPRDIANAPANRNSLAVGNSLSALFALLMGLAFDLSQVLIEFLEP